jgi:hypothetical protein
MRIIFKKDFNLTIVQTDGCSKRVSYKLGNIVKNVEVEKDQNGYYTVKYENGDKATSCSNGIFSIHSSDEG